MSMPLRTCLVSSYSSVSLLLLSSINAFNSLLGGFRWEWNGFGWWWRFLVRRSYLSLWMEYVDLFRGEMGVLGEGWGHANEVWAWWSVVVSVSVEDLNLDSLFHGRRPRSVEYMYGEVVEIKVLEIKRIRIFDDLFCLPLIFFLYSRSLQFFCFLACKQWVCRGCGYGQHWWGR